jgi:hypothetical protein
MALTGYSTWWTTHASAYSVDVDGDGDLDILGTTCAYHTIVWWKNVAGEGSAWTEHTVDAGFSGATGVHAADVDADGDLDVLGAAEFRDAIAWRENRGGQFALATGDTAPTSMNAGTMDDILEIEVTHRSRAGDGDLELVTLELRFQGCY